jgi:hypothetical protein
MAVVRTTSRSQPRRGDVVAVHDTVHVMLLHPMPNGWWRGREMGSDRIEDGRAYVVDSDRATRLLYRPTGWCDL